MYLPLLIKLSEKETMLIIIDKHANYSNISSKKICYIINFTRVLQRSNMLLKVVFFILVGTTYGDVHKDFFLKPGSVEKLWPTTSKGREETSWTFSAEPGAKIIASCVIMINNCEEHELIIDNGTSVSRHCGNDSYALKNADDSKMMIKIINVGRNEGSFCSVSATKPFLRQVFRKRDSSEDGQKEGKRQPSCKCGWTNKPKNRIVGGVDANPNEYPWAVLLGLRRNNYQYCGGSIIAPKFVLTAAHCTYPYRGLRLSVFVGEHDLRKSKDSKYTEKIDVKKAHDHPEYVDKTNYADISVLELVKPITFSQYVGPVCLPGKKPNMLDDYVKVMGWGHTSTKGEISQILQKVDLKVIDLDICRTVYPKVPTSKSTQVCTWASGRDSCQGDSGGPLVWLEPETNRLTQIGVVSFGKLCGSTDPAVNTDVHSYVDWIETIINGIDGSVCKA